MIYKIAEGAPRREIKGAVVQEMLAPMQGISALVRDVQNGSTGERVAHVEINGSYLDGKDTYTFTQKTARRLKTGRGDARVDGAILLLSECGFNINNTPKHRSTRYELKDMKGRKVVINVQSAVQANNIWVGGAK